MLLYGALAGGAAETAVYPLAVVQRRLQLSAMRVNLQSLRTNQALRFSYASSYIHS